MKSSVNTFGLNIKSSANFEKNIAKFFPTVKEINISDLSLFTHSGYGQYRDYLYLSLDGEDFKINIYHTNSQQVDWYKSDEFDNLGERTKDNFIKSKVLSIIEENADYLNDKING